MSDREGGCAFCRIATEDPEGQVLRDWGSCVVIRPLSPVVPGHLLVVPKRHTDAASSDPVVTGDAFRCAAYEAQMLRSSGHGVNLITSDGRTASQTVMHLHVHVVPRHLGDGVALPWTAQVVA